MLNGSSQMCYIFLVETMKEYRIFSILLENTYIIKRMRRLHFFSPPYTSVLIVHKKITARQAGKSVVQID